MELVEEEFVKKPKTIEDVIRCLNGVVMDPSIAFYEGSKFCRNISAELIKSTINSLSEKLDVPRYTLALMYSIDAEESDEELQENWRSNIDDLRVLYGTSPKGTARQAEKLINVGRNTRLVRGMCKALKSEIEIDRRAIEPTWLAVLYAEGSEQSVAEFKRIVNFLKPETVAYLERYSGKANAI